VADTDLLPPPAALGLPEFFDSWRQHQPAAILRAIESDKRFTALVLPTGAGKSLTVISTAILPGWRTCVLTSTKNLQSQYSRDFSPVGLVDVRGQNAYACVAFEDEHQQFQDPLRYQSCEEGPCHSGHRCSRKPTPTAPEIRGCAYYDAIADARKAPLVVTNYKFWLTQNYYGQGIGKFDCLVLDEAHNAPQELADFLSTELSSRDIDQIVQSALPSDTEDIDKWALWAKREAARIERLLEQWHPHSRHEMLRYRHTKAVGRKLGVLSLMKADEWIVHQNETNGAWHFDPVWVHAHAAKLFLATPRIVLTSATFARKTAAMLGVGADDLTWHESPSDFPVARRPIYYVPTVKLTHKAFENDPALFKIWIARIDQIIDQRLDRKGIIHSVSYKRRNEIMQFSEHKDRMITHDSQTARHAIERFKQAAPGTILVSPSMTTGVDFPGKDCEYQIITKIPFPDSRSPVVKARTAVDGDYPAYIAMQELVQAVGRGMRSRDDQCESFVVDDNCKWFVPKYREMAPAWFLQAYRKVDALPTPLPVLEEE
jgi:ATP-dependent DNA helicase DinG